MRLGDETSPDAEGPRPAPPGSDGIDGRVTRLLLEYARSAPGAGPLEPEMSLRADLGVESLSLVSLAVRLGEELDADLTELGIDLGEVQTVGDLVALGRVLSRSKPPVGAALGPERHPFNEEQGIMTTDSTLPSKAGPDATEAERAEERISPEEPQPDPELRVTVRKLEMPVRPRGVLAE